MGLFKRKPDPLAQRAQTLNRKIAELEAEIARLNQNLGDEGGQTGSAGVSGGTGSTGRASAGPAGRAGSGAGAGRAGGMAGTGLASQEPVFEQMPPRPVAAGPSEEGPGGEAVALGLKRPAWSQWWRRLKSRLVDPPPANEKLVNYLAAGGIQGLRPLRFERRIARNRIIFVCVVLGLMLWGLLVMFRHSH